MSVYINRISVCTDLPIITNARDKCAYYVSRYYPKYESHQEACVKPPASQWKSVQPIMPATIVNQHPMGLSYSCAPTEMCASSASVYYIWTI